MTSPPGYQNASPVRTTRAGSPSSSNTISPSGRVDEVAQNYCIYAPGRGLADETGPLDVDPITAMQGKTADEAPTKKLDANRLTLMCGRLVKQTGSSAPMGRLRRLPAAGPAAVPGCWTGGQ